MRTIIRERGVDVVVGFGGYASAPAYVAARRERVPVVVHEANARPGLANVLGARWAAGSGVAFDGTPLRGARVVGMPLRREVVDLDRAERAEAAAFFGLDADSPHAARLRGLARRPAPERGPRRLVAGHPGGGVAADPRDRRAVDARGSGRAGYALRRYVDRMDLAFAAADAIVSRAGAATVSEISALGIPAVYVPYAVGNGEQRLNARSAVEAGAAVLIDDADFTPDRVRSESLPLLADRDRIDAMAAAAASIGTRTGTENVIAMIDEALAR